MAGNDDTKRFISKQNVLLIASMTSCPFQKARDEVIEWVRSHSGYIPSLQQANESVIHKIQNIGMPQRPYSAAQETPVSMEDRIRKMQQERDSMTPGRRPPQGSMGLPPQPQVIMKGANGSQAQASLDTAFTIPEENTLETVQTFPKNMQEKEELSRITSQRLEEMQRERSLNLPIPPPSSTESQSQSHAQSQSTRQPTSKGTPLSMVFHSNHAEKKKGQDWWERGWVIPELYSMAMASQIEIPSLYIHTNKKLQFNSLLMKIKNVSGGGETWILTPSLTKYDNVVQYVVKEEQIDTNQNSTTWRYRLEPSLSTCLDWNRKTDRVDISLISLGEEFGRFLDEEEVVSWSIIIKWYRPA